jgi:hypothetical protein
MPLRRTGFAMAIYLGLMKRVCHLDYGPSLGKQNVANDKLRHMRAQILT